MFSIRHLILLALVATALVAEIGCVTKSKGENYLGKWECSSGTTHVIFEIKAKNGVLLLLEPTGEKVVAVGDDGKLIVDGQPLLGRIEMSIDDVSGELHCPACTCTKYKKIK